VSREAVIQAFIDRANLFAGIMADAGLPVRFHEYYRGEQAQNEAFARGASKARFGQSPHNFGLAADYHFDPHGWNVPKEWWQYGDRVARYIGLESGLDYGDANHIQLARWKQWKAYFLV